MKKKRYYNLLKGITALDFEGVKTYLSLAPKAVNRCRDHVSPLHEAILTGNMDMLDVLLDYGANLHLRPGESHLPALSFACIHAGPQIISRLIERGADIEIKDAGGMTPLFHAAGRRSSSAVETLIELGANVRALDHEGRNILDHAKLMAMITGTHKAVNYLENVLSALREKEDLSEAIAANTPLKKSNAKNRPQNHQNESEGETPKKDRLRL